MSLKESSESAWAPLCLGLFLVGVASIAWWFAGEIDVRFQSENDPGPRAFPKLLAVALFAGGMWELLRGVWRVVARRRESLAMLRNFRSPAAARTLGFMAVVAAYITGLTLVGYVLTSLVAGICLMTWLEFGPMRKRLKTRSATQAFLAAAAMSVLATSLIVAGAYVLFWYGFRVILPAGDLFS